MTDLNCVDNEGIHQLVVGIVKQAMTDYKYALQGRRQGHSYGPMIGAEAMEDWFLSQYGQLLCAGHGVAVIESVRRDLGLPLKKRYGSRRKTAKKSVLLRRSIKIDPAVQWVRKAKEEKRTITVTVEVDCPADGGQAVQDALSAYLEKFGGTKVLSIRGVTTKMAESGGEA